MLNTNEQLDKILKIVKDLEKKIEKLEQLIKSHEETYIHNNKLDYS